VEIPIAKLDPSSCSFGNSAEIISPEGNTAENSDPMDDTAPPVTVTVEKKVDPNGKVICDPPHLKVEKVANPQACTKAAGGYECSYKVTVTSTGPDPFHGKIELDETIPSGATLKSVSSSWMCADQGAAFHCTYNPNNNPKVDLAVGSNVELDVTVTVPDASIKPGACQVTNKVNLALSAGPLQGQNYEASATAEIRGDACGSSSSGTALPAAPPAVPTCPPGYNWVSPHCVQIKENLPNCPPGTSGVFPDCKSSKPVTQQPAPQPQCDPGWSKFGNARRIPKGWEARRVTLGGHTIICARASISSAPVVQQPALQPQCDPGWTQFRANRIPKGWEARRVTLGGKTIICARASTSASPSTQRPSCTPGPNEHATSSGCACNVGFSRDHHGRCRPVSCPPGTSGTPPDCKAVEQLKPTCPEGTVGTPPRCHHLKPLSCPAGMTGTPPDCEAVEQPKPGAIQRNPGVYQPSQPSCGPGMKYENGKCVQDIR